MNKATLITAVNQALLSTMEENDAVCVLGEDVGINGGVFRATAGLQEKFGDKRVIDMPLAEGLIAGVGIGMAHMGLRPVCEFQFMGFIYPACEQLISHASRWHYRSQGKRQCPIVFRAPYGGHIHAPEHHSESTEALFAHIPGIRVVVPSSPQAGFSLLKQAIDCNDPVLFLEPKKLYHNPTQLITVDNPYYQLNQPFIEQMGRDITVIGWGAMMPVIRQAAAVLKQHNILLDVIDLVSLQPIDYRPLIDSIKRTRRLCLVQEACRSGGIASEIIATLSETGLLTVPAKRLTASDTHPPPHRFEHTHYPTTNQLVATCQTLMELTHG